MGTACPKWGVFSLETTRGKQHPIYQITRTLPRRFHSRYCPVLPSPRICDLDLLITVEFYSHCKPLGVAPGHWYLKSTKVANIRGAAP